MTSSHELDLRRTIRRAIEDARRCWGADWTPTRAAVAPGRIEILGSHVDYNGGPVLAAAVDRATVVLSDDSAPLEFLFADFRALPSMGVTLDRADEIRSEYGNPQPHDFVLGVLDRSRVKSRSVRPGRAVVATSIPIGSGMSSSAALSVALSLLLNEEPPTGAELVYDAQAAENWTGVPCGTMDQSASVFGQVIRYEGPERSASVAPDLDGFCFVVVDSRVKRTLGTSSYPKRVAECAEAVKILEETWGRQIGQLAALTDDDFAAIDLGNPSILPPILHARVRHIVTDIRRVGEGEIALDTRDWEAFGALMNASGESSAGDYAISHPRVEELVATMRSVPGVVGARMMGGGDGGSTLALLRVEALDDLRSELVAFFSDESMRTGVVPLSFAPGARLLSSEELHQQLQ